MAILLTGDKMARITDALSILTINVKLRNSRGRTDINAAAEDFYCGLLNILLGTELENLNALQMDFPAIDLADREARLCVQVTSTEGRGKVNHTLEKFYERDMEQDFDRLLILVIGEKDRFKKAFPGKGTFVFDPQEDIWDTAKLLAEIERLPEPKLDEVDAYLGKHLNISRQEDKPLLDLPLRTAMDARNFVGREEELAEIRERFGKNEQIVVLSGLGGMGKTELAVRFARQYGGGQTYFVSFRQDFYHTVTDEIAPGIEGLAEQKLDEDAKYAAVMKVLHGCGREDLLILDNADTEEESVFRDLCWHLKDLPLRTLLTTRRKAANALEIAALKPEMLRQIFENYDIPDISTEEMDALIAAVKGHTMTVDLIARTLEESWGAVTPQDILKAMEHSTLPEESYPEVYTDHNRDPEQRQIYAHLRALFNLVNIPPEGKNALRCATLLPGGGMDAVLFLKALPTECGKAIQLLEKQGWVRREKNILAIHPVVRLVCKAELKPSEETCGTFLDALWEQFDPMKHERVKFAQLAEVFANAMEIGGAPQTKAEWLNCSGRLWLDLMESRKCAALYETYIPVLEPQISDHLALAAAYNNAGMTYGALGDHARALEYLLKALAILEKVLPPEHPSLATSYNNVGFTYGELGDHAKALEYKQKALAICEKVLPPEHPHLAASYNNVGITYGALGDHSKALEYKQKALAICEKVLPRSHPDLATSYNSVGCTYYALGDHARALEYQQKALAIREKVLPPEHPDLAASYNNVGNTYDALGDHAKALEYHQKALAIREKALPPEHPDFAVSYISVGYTYYAMGDYAKALEYHQKALAICEKVLPPEHPDLATSYNNLGGIYYAMGDHAKALEYHQKALAIQEKSLPENHPYNAACCGNIAKTYYQLGDFETAQAYIRRATDIAERSIPEGHPSRTQIRMIEMMLESAVSQRRDSE